MQDPLTKDDIPTIVQAVLDALPSPRPTGPTATASSGATITEAGVNSSVPSKPPSNQHTADQRDSTSGSTTQLPAEQHGEPSHVDPSKPYNYKYICT